jgi:hypothetical protein
VRHRGQFCYLAAILPGHRQPTPILRLRYQGSADHWAIGIYLASDERYTESELPAFLRTQDRHPRTRHRPHLHPLRRPQHSCLMAMPDDPQPSRGCTIRTAKTAKLKRQTAGRQTRPHPPLPGARPGRPHHLRRVNLRDHVIGPILAGVRSPSRGREPARWTQIDRHYQALRTTVQALFHDLGISTEAATT